MTMPRRSLGMPVRTICSMYLPSAAFRRKSSAAAAKMHERRHQTGSRAARCPSTHQNPTTPTVGGEPADTGNLPSSLVKSRSARSGTSAGISLSMPTDAARCCPRAWWSACWERRSAPQSAQHGQAARPAVRPRVGAASPRWCRSVAPTCAPRARRGRWATGQSNFCKMELEEQQVRFDHGFDCRKS